MTVAGPRQDTPRCPPQPPRRGVRRRGGSAANPVALSGATSWYDAHDGSGLQQIPSRIGDGVATLGSTTGADANDPTWSSSPYGWAIDATDDYISTAGSTMLPTFTVTSGAYTFLTVATLPAAAGKVYWCIGNLSTLFMAFRSSTNSIVVAARGPLVNNTSTAQAVGTAGTRVVVGFVLNNGTVNTYYYNGTTGTLGTNYDITGHGDFSANYTTPRYGAFSYSVTGSLGSTMHAMIDYNGVALSKATMDSISAYILATF